MYYEHVTAKQSLLNLGTFLNIESNS